MFITSYMLVCILIYLPACPLSADPPSVASVVAAPHRYSDIMIRIRMNKNLARNPDFFVVQWAVRTAQKYKRTRVQFAHTETVSIHRLSHIFVRSIPQNSIQHPRSLQCLRCCSQLSNYRLLSLMKSDQILDTDSK